MSFAKFRQMMMGFCFVSMITASQVDGYCAKCHKIETKRLEEQSNPSYQEKGYYDDYIKQNEQKAENNQLKKQLRQPPVQSKNSSVEKELLSYLSANYSAQTLAAIDTIYLPSEELKSLQKPVQSKQLTKIPPIPISTIADVLSMETLMEVFKKPFTILIPSDQAIKNFSFATLQKMLQPQNQELLFSYIANHIVSHQILRKDFNKNFKTLGGRLIEITSLKNGDLTINGHATILESLPLGDHGIMYVMDRVLIPIHE